MNCEQSTNGWGGPGIVGQRFDLLTISLCESLRPLRTATIIHLQHEVPGLSAAANQLGQEKKVPSLARIEEAQIRVPEGNKVPLHHQTSLLSFLCGERKKRHERMQFLFTIQIRKV